MSVSTPLPVSVAIVADANPVCSGTTVTFTATPTNGGTPSYQWKLNGGNVGTNLPSYSYIPSNGDLVSCVMTSSLSCTSGNPATSNIITMSVTTPASVSVLISASANPVCAGSTVIFTATPTNGGTPSYQWKLNGGNVGTNLPSYSYIPSNGDLVSCVMTSSLSCTTGNSATSNTITMSVTSVPGSPMVPIGPDTVYSITTPTTAYTTTTSLDAVSYIWELTPTSAGTITGTDTIGTVTWDPAYLGTATLTVKAVNGCGESFWSAGKQTFVDNTTGIQTYESLRIDLYPNPNDGRFSIRSSEKISKIMIFEQLGKPIAEIEYPDTLFVYDYSHLPNGVYIVHIVSTTKTVVKKIIITK